MSTVSLMARRPLKYAGQRLAIGAVFEATSPRDARVLVTIGLAEVAPPAVTPVAPIEDEDDVAPVTVPVKRRYRRRDLQADD